MLACAPGADADHRDPSPWRKSVEIAGHVGLADQFEDHVERPVLLEALGCDDVVRAERDDISVPGGVADGRSDVRAGRRRQLNGGGADAARRAVDADAFAHRQAALGEQRIVGGRERLGEATGGFEHHAVGHRHQQTLVDDEPRRLSPATDDCHDPVADGEAFGPFSQRDHLTREFEAGDVGRCVGGRGVEPGSLKQIGGVESRRLDRHEHVTGSGFGIRPFGDFEISVVYDKAAHDGAR